MDNKWSIYRMLLSIPLICVTLWLIGCESTTQKYSTYTIEDEYNIGPREYLYPRLTPPRANPHYSHQVKDGIEIIHYRHGMKSLGGELAEDYTLAHQVININGVKEASIIVEEPRVLIGVKTTKRKKEDIKAVFDEVKNVVSKEMPDHHVVVKGKRGAWYKLYYQTG